jgi:hypothetical protein
MMVLGPGIKPFAVEQGLGGRGGRANPSERCDE